MGLFDLFKKRKKEVVYDKQMEVLFCFLKNTFTCADMLDLMEQSGEFKPRSVSRLHDFVFLDAGMYNEIRNADAESNELLWAGGLTFLDENKRRLFFHNGPNKEKCQVIYWQVDSVQFLESAVFRKLISHNNFISAYCFNSDDDLIQNMTWLPVYEKRGIKPRATRKNHLGQVEVDIEKNPGKSYITAQTWLKSSWRIWFGKIFYSLVPKEKIQQFDKAWSIKELDNSVISVQLYENHEAFDDKNNRQIQMSFREWMDYPKLEELNPNYNRV
jgi:hypothetical protein